MTSAAPYTPRRRVDSDYDRILEMLGKGLTKTQVRERLGVSATTIKRAIDYQESKFKDQSMTDESITVTTSCGCVFADLEIPCRQEPSPCPVCVERGNC